ncbi:electron transport complex subunit RsxC, partial [Salmonella enterica subsp. enterica serovar Enteritidis]
RLEREKSAREQRHKQAAVKLTDSDQQAVKAAIERLAGQKNTDAVIAVQAGETPDNSAVIAAREARKAQARARQEEKQQSTVTATVSIDDR